jgi:hypothetical protein
MVGVRLKPDSSKKPRVTLPLTSFFDLSSIDFQANFVYLFSGALLLAELVSGS